MWKAFFGWLGENYPSILLAVVAIVVVWVVSQVYFSIKHRLKDTESKLQSLPCEEHRNSIESHSSMKITLESINDQVTEISKWILRFDNSESTVNALVQKCSPRRMTSLGRNLFDFSGAKKTVEENAAFFLSEVSKEAPATPFDVEQASLNSVLRNIGNPIFNDIKNFIYYQPEKIELSDEKGEKQLVKVSLNSLIQLMSIEIRDRFLVNHPEIR